MLHNREQLTERVRQGFTDCRVMVVGDVILDRYLWGEVNRISPEAPVPVVRIKRESENCGGAANVACNLTGLGVATFLTGYVGQDTAAAKLHSLLDSQAIAHDLTERQHWPTLTKTRVIGGHQQMLRLDWEKSDAPLAEEQARLMAAIGHGLARGPQTIILSDYAKGVLDGAVCSQVIQQGRSQHLQVLVDPKGVNYEKYRHATTICPNRQELAAATGQPLDDLEGLLRAGVALRHALEIDFLVVTLSDLGLALIDDEGVRRLPAMAREVYDVSGAGDTVIATLAAALAAGWQRLDALHLANLAAGVVVGKLGTTPINRPELLAALEREQALEHSSKIASLPQVAQRVELWRRQGEKVVFTNGCFDLLHAGHVTYLEKARQLGQRLVVGLNSDGSVRQLKGPNRPIIGESDRARVLAAMAAVDAVVIFSEETPLDLIQTLRPDVLVKGADYAEHQVVGGDLVKSWGGQVVLVPLVSGRSSSTIVATIQERGESLTPS